MGRRAILRVLYLRALTPHQYQEGAGAVYMSRLRSTRRVEVEG